MRAAATYPDPVRAAMLAEAAGADGITAHLREDRRHISDADIERLSRELHIPLNLEMAATDEMLAIALKAPPACRLHRAGEARGSAPPKAALTRRASTTVSAHRRGADGGRHPRLACSSSPTASSSMPPRRSGAPVVELHTGAYANAAGAATGTIAA